MTHRQMVLETIRRAGPLSSYGVFHAARGFGFKMSPSSVRTRIAEIGSGLRTVGTETTPSGRKATVYDLNLR